MRSTSVSIGLLALILSTLTFGGARSASAWDVAIGTNFLDSALYLGSWSGPQPTWTSIDERVRASDTPGPTVPISWVSQSWDPMIGEWPSDYLEAFDGATDASIYHDAVDVEFWDSATAYISGSISTGDAVGAGFAYDFELTLSPFTTANVELDPLETFVYIESSPSDVGTGFAQAKLYQTDVDINDPGGANLPLASAFYSIQAGDPFVDTQPGFTGAFTNSTPSPVTYNLRFEASVSVLEVPEPALATSVLLGGLFLAGMGRARR